MLLKSDGSHKITIMRRILCLLKFAETILRKKNMKIKIIARQLIISILLAFILFSVSFAITHATGNDNIPSDQLVPCDDCTLCHLYVGILRIYTYLVWTVLYWIAATMVVIAGVLYMISTGSKLIETAKKTLQYAIGGFLLAVCSWLIIAIIMNALGATNAGSWFIFKCDDTPASQKNWDLKSVAVSPSDTGAGAGAGATPDNNAGAGAKTVATGGAGSYQPSGNLDPRVQKVLENYMTMVGMKYEEKFSGDTYGGKSTADCGSTSIRAWLMGGLPDFWGLPRERWDGDPNSLKPGDICIFDKSVKDHAFLVMENGATSGANHSKGIYYDPSGLNSNIRLLKGNSQLLYVVHIANYLK
jgi:hypothetical protein